MDCPDDDLATRLVCWARGRWTKIILLFFVLPVVWLGQLAIVGSRIVWFLLGWIIWDH